MKRTFLLLLIVIPISLVVSVLLLLASAFVGGACHCMTPISVVSPYGTFITMRTKFQTAGFLADIFQLPLYAAIITIMNGLRRRLIAVLIILIVHTIAAIGALTMYRWW